jgi:hypothetical protein
MLFKTHKLFAASFTTAYFILQSKFQLPFTESADVNLSLFTESLAVSVAYFSGGLPD